MKRGILGAAILALVCFTFAWSQTAKTAKQPKVKSKGEMEAIQAIFGAQDPDARVKAADALLMKYADTEFKSIALMLAAMSYQQKGDVEKMIVYAERTVEADPDNYQCLLMLASAIAQRTREFDLDREEKLGQVAKYAQRVMDLVKVAPKPNPTLPDEQWEVAKKDMTAQAHEALGISGIARKKYDAAIAEFKLALEIASVPDPATQVRLGMVYNLAGKHDDALAVLDKVINSPNVDARIKQFAQAEKVRALQAKGAISKPAAAPATTPAPAQPEAKKP
jgi:tetratricopeptide (TPR) repeat protein